jgi:hypothetical protein
MTVCTSLEEAELLACVEDGTADLVAVAGQVDEEQGGGGGEEEVAGLRCSGGKTKQLGTVVWDGVAWSKFSMDRGGANTYGIQRATCCSSRSLLGAPIHFKGVERPPTW